MNKFVITVNGNRYYPKLFTFSGGEVSVKLPDHLRAVGCNTYVLKAKLRSSEDIMTLLMLKNALDIRVGAARSVLEIPYVPYSRQDRVCNEGEALSIKVLAELVNSMNFDTVYTYDNHSDVSTALINNCINFPPEKIMGRNLEIKSLLTKTKISLCPPDAGANKKVLKVAQFFGGVPIIKADKIRDTATGEITHTEVYCDDLRGQSVFVVDDLADGAKTFVYLAEKLKEKGAGKLFLYVTHGIFSKGLDCVYEAGYDKVYTTDSWQDVGSSDERLQVIKL